MKRLVRFLIAERVAITVVLINTFALILMGFTDPSLLPNGQAQTTLAQQLFQFGVWVDYSAVIYFLLEAILKVRVLGFGQYWKSSWNRFDFIIVLLSSPLLLAPWLDVSTLSVLLALRLGRLFRLFRLMRFIPNRAHLLVGVQRALKASIGVFFALLLMNLVLSVGATQLFGRLAPEHFGNPALSSYSLFKVFTVEGWYEIPDLLASRATHPVMGVLARVYFVFSVLVGGLLGFALANAIFVDEMTMDNNDALENKVDALHEELRALRAEIKAVLDR